MRLFLFAALALGACQTTGGDPAGVDARAAFDAAVTTCPAAAPGDGAACDEPDQACIYERCATDGMVRASCTAGRWSVTTEGCQPDACAGYGCAPGSVCTAQVGGAYLVMCRAHSCGDGPLTCDCVCGEGAHCELGDTGGSGGEFTCYIDCGAEICP